MPFGKGDDSCACAFIVQTGNMFKVLNYDHLPFGLVIHEILKQSSSHAFRCCIIHTLIKAEERRVNDEQSRIILRVVSQILSKHQGNYSVKERSVTFAMIR